MDVNFWCATKAHLRTMDEWHLNDIQVTSKLFTIII
jgi:hypothetical protein